jgi:Fic family protein
LANASPAERGLSHEEREALRAEVDRRARLRAEIAPRAAEEEAAAIRVVLARAGQEGATIAEVERRTGIGVKTCRAIIARLSAAGEIESDDARGRVRARPMLAPRFILGSTRRDHAIVKQNSWH